MKKITWDAISVELTRKCQLHCEHCYKGKAQNLDISHDTIDNWLAQTEHIGELRFTGGEPTINTEGMRYILDGLYRYRIPLMRLNIITNGYEISDDFVQIIKDYNELISICHLFDKTILDTKNYIHIAVSNDRYHKGYDIMGAVEKLKSVVQDYATIHTTEQGNLPISCGNAEGLPEASRTHKILPEYKRRIEVMTKDYTPSCPHAQSGTYKLLHDNQALVICDMSLTAKGDLGRFPLVMWDYDKEDNSNDIVCNVNNSVCIYDDIIAYNNGKISCCEAQKKEKADMFKPLNMLLIMAESVRLQKVNPSVFEDSVGYLDNGLVK